MVQNAFYWSFCPIHGWNQCLPCRSPVSSAIPQKAREFHLPVTIRPRLLGYAVRRVRCRLLPQHLMYPPVRDTITLYCPSTSLQSHPHQWPEGPRFGGSPKIVRVKGHRPLA